MRKLRPETGESLAIFFKTLIKFYLFYLLICLLTVSQRVSRVRNFGYELKNCRPMRQIFLHEYVNKCAMVISNYNYPMVLLEKGY